MLISRYTLGITLPHFDAAVSKAFDFDLDGGGNKMVIAVENAEGKVYRVIETTGMGAYMHTINALLAIGFTDDLAESLHGENGFDSRLVPRAELLRAPIVAEMNDDPASELLGSLEELSDLTETERRSVLKSRVGQGAFRTAVIGHWGKCAVTGASCQSLLRASHIKPWRDSTNKERLDPFNGLLLAPNLDAAFDAGFITFDKQGRIVLSRSMTGAIAYELHINAKMRLDAKVLAAEHHCYLEYHREHVYIDA